MLLKSIGIIEPKINGRINNGKNNHNNIPSLNVKIFAGGFLIEKN